MASKSAETLQKMRGPNPHRDLENHTAKGLNFLVLSSTSVIARHLYLLQPLRPLKSKDEMEEVLFTDTVENFHQRIAAAHQPQQPIWAMSKFKKPPSRYELEIDDRSRERGS